VGYSETLAYFKEHKDDFCADANGCCCECQMWQFCKDRLCEEYDSCTARENGVDCPAKGQFEGDVDE
jgi:hypothetical protein